MIKPIVNYTEYQGKKAMGIDSPNVHSILQDLADTRSAANAAGLAAPQIGVPRRIMVVLNEDGQEIQLIAPKIIAQTGSQDAIEACLSTDDKENNRYYGARILRPHRIQVAATSPEFHAIIFEATGTLAGRICHEIDNLNGITFMDHVLANNLELLAFSSMEERKEARERAPLHVYDCGDSNYKQDVTVTAAKVKIV